MFPTRVHSIPLRSTVCQHAWKSIIIVLLMACKAWANVGQPGIWKAGGGISLLVPDDSLVSQMIVMESERVDVLLYSGFAVVHGRYHLYNSGEKNIHFVMGYPINQVWQNAVYPKDQDPFGYSFRVDSLAHFEVAVDGVRKDAFADHRFDDWVTWNIHFSAGQRQVIEVTYLTPTDQSKVTNMQGVRKTNGFVYIFETGAQWKDLIGRAELFVHLFDGLSEEDIEAVRPCGSIQSSVEAGILYLKKENWKPTEGENVYLTYNRRSPKYYSFEEAIEDKSFLYDKAKDVATSTPDLEGVKVMECVDVLDVETQSPYGRIVAYVLGGTLVIFLGIVAFIVIIIKKRTL